MRVQRLGVLVRRVVVAALAVLLAAPLAVASGAPVWHEAVTVAPLVGPPGSLYGVPGATVVAVPGGGWLTAWVQDGGAVAADVAPGGAFAQPVVVDSAARTTPGIGVDGTGAAVLASAGPDGVRGATRSPRGAWSAPVTLAPVADFQLPVVAVNAKGDAVVAWRERTSAPSHPQLVRAVLRPAGGDFGAVETISTSTVPVSPPDVTIAPDGTALVTWGRSVSTNRTVNAAVHPPGGPWQALGAVSTSDTGFNSSAAFDGTSAASILWSDRASDALTATDRPAGGAFGTPSPLGVTGLQGSGVIAGRPAGGFVIAWTAGTSIRVAARDGGVLGAAADAGPASETSLPVLAVGSDGQTLIASQLPDGGVQVALRSAAGAVSEAQRVSDPGESGSWVSAAAAASDTGNALVLWSRQVTGGWSLRAAVRSDSTAAATPPPGVPQAPPAGPRAPAKIRVLRAGVSGGVLDMLVEITSRAATKGAKLDLRYLSSGQTTKFSVPIPTVKSASSGPRARAAETSIKIRKQPRRRRRVRGGPRRGPRSGRVVRAGRVGLHGVSGGRPDRLHAGAARALGRAHAARSRAVWELHGAPERVTIDVDATLITAHSEKEDAAGNYKGGYGFHPLQAYCDETREALGGAAAAGERRREHRRRSDRGAEAGAGADPGRAHRVRSRSCCAPTPPAPRHELLDWCREANMRFSVGYELTETVRAAILQIPDEAWVCALDQDGSERENGQVAEITDSSTCPPGRRGRG